MKQSNPLESKPQPLLTERTDIEISEKFMQLNPVNRETVQKEIVEKYKREDILEVLDDSEHGRRRPETLFLLLDILDPKSSSKTLVAPLVIASSFSSPEVKKMAQEHLDAMKTE